MDQDRSVLGVADVLEDRQKVVDVVTVDRSDIEEAELVEQGTAGDQPAGVFFNCQGALLQHLAWQPLGNLMKDLAQPMITAPRHAAREIVVEHDD